MYQHLRRGLIAPVAFAWATALVSPFAAASPVASFDFDDAALQFQNAADFVAPGLAASAWSDLDGTLTSPGGNPGKALGAKSFNDGNTLHFTLSVAHGYLLHLSGFSFDTQVSTTGPKLWTLSIGGDALASGATATSFQTSAGSFAEKLFTGAVDIGVSGSGATAAGGTLRLDNFTLEGRVAPVPLPAAAWLALLPGVGLLRRRRPAS